VRPTHDIWSASLGDDGEWGDARHLPATINDPDRDEWCPAVAASGNLYFASDRPGTSRGTDLWVARMIDGVYQPPENLGDAINTKGDEFEAWIAPDESYLLFSAVHRADGQGGYDLFLSRRRDGRWEHARPLTEINTAASEYNESVSRMASGCTSAARGGSTARSASASTIPGTTPRSPVSATATTTCIAFRWPRSGLADRLSINATPCHDAGRRAATSRTRA